MEFYTKQYCQKCGETIKIDALDFLMNLDNPDICICNKCKELEINNVSQERQAKTKVRS